MPRTGGAGQRSSASCGEPCRNTPHESLFCFQRVMWPLYIEAGLQSAVKESQRHLLRGRYPQASEGLNKVRGKKI